MNQPRYTKGKIKKPHDKMFWVLLVSFLVFVSLTAYLAFSMVQDAVSALGNAPDRPVIQEPPPEPAQNQEKFLDVSNPLQTGNGPPPIPWDGKTPVTLLLLGVDYRDWVNGNGPPLTDTIILATIDPQSRTAGMLSLPRDLWVDIPGYGYHKINQAYSLGEANHEPAGGAGLVLKTVEGFLDIPIPYYALVDFNAFIRVVDEIGGVKINVPESIEVDPLGDNNTQTLQPGVQTLPGEIALAYVRTRDTAGSDFDRIQRQQQVILGIQKRLISFEIIPILMDKAPTLYNDVASGVKTNLTLEQTVQLAWLTTRIPESNIKNLLIGSEQVTNAISWEGMAILQPIPEEILKMRDLLFSVEPVSSPEIVVNMDPVDRIIEENANVIIRNGTITPGLATRTQEYLLERDINVTWVGNADQVYAGTTLIDYTGKPYTVAYLAEILNIPPNKIFQRFDPESTVDITIILGEDWVENNDLP